MNDHIVNIMEELSKFTLLSLVQSRDLTDLYFERKESAEELSKWFNQKNIKSKHLLILRFQSF